MIVTLTGYRAMTRRLLDLADELCGGRLVIVHEGGYSPFFVPYCGVAVIELLAGVESGVEFPWEDVWSDLPDQPLKPHQADVIERAAALLDVVRGSAVPT
jgi:acetoin utilization deacetylase AcuC-like enzyme